MASAGAVAQLIRSHRLRPIELLPWVLAVAAYFLFGTYLPLGSQILIAILFAMSLDIVLGYAGIVTLGQAAFFGAGAYAAGIYAVHVSAEPLSGLLVGAAAAAIVGLVSGLIILRTSGLTLLMLTLAITSLLEAAANDATSITGGNDGLSVSINSILGLFDFDLYGRTAYLYCLAVLFLAWLFVRRMLHAPFGQSLIGIRENVVRMHAIGVPVRRRLLTAYTISAALAGIAGALLTQTTQFVSLSVLSFERSGAIVIMLVLGGAGRLYGAFIGAALYMIAQDQLAELDPVFWDFWIGLLLVLIVLFARGGVLGLADRLLARVVLAAMSAVLETTGLAKRFGALVVANGIDFRLEAGARHALIGPNGAGKTTFINLITGRLMPSAGRIRLNGADITALPQAERVKRGLGRTFQINTLFRGLSVLENVSLAVGEHAGIGAGLFRRIGARRDVIERAYALLERLGIADDAMLPVKELPYGKQRLVEIAIALGLDPTVLLLDEPAAGVPSAENRIILDVIAQLPESVAVLIIEHDMELVFRFAQRITVLVQGAVLVEGSPAEIAADERVREVYLGERHNA